MQIAVIGSGADWIEQAEEVGRLLAERGCVVVCGGLDEVMAAAARGAKGVGGTTVGILPGTSASDASPWVDYAVATGTGHARNLAVVASCEAAIAVGGSWGTAAEIAYARLLDRPVVVLGTGPGVEGDGIAHAETPAEAVELALGLVGAR
ncbi:MAG TPA: TIGR00725 family protein [Gaiellaceae bacterium]|nr:TIGR00725 family protein [Gaiellaceae bacterium]